VVVAARRPGPLQEIVAKVKAAGGEASYVTGDLTTEEGMQRAVAHTEATFGRLDVMFNNLGDSAGRGLQLHETPMDDWNYLMDINLKAAYLCTKYAVPAFRKAGRGVIIHLSASYDIRVRGHAGYGAAKMGLIGLTQNTALAYRKDNIRVVCLCPNGMGGEIFGDATDLPAPELMRRGTAQDLAWAALFFASDEASWLTGLVVPVDGGNELTTATTQ
jgi:NAD(P)-dependent dehydrogenase (short-subunit alcohol dehydrogenase family)